MLVPFPDHGEIPLFPDRMMIQATSIYIRATFGLGSIYAAALIKKKMSMRVPILWRRALIIMRDLKKEAKPHLSCMIFPVIPLNIQP